MKGMHPNKLVFWSHLEYPGGFFVPMRQVVRRRKRR